MNGSIYLVSNSCSRTIFLLWLDEYKYFWGIFSEIQGNCTKMAKFVKFVETGSYGSLLLAPAEGWWPAVAVGPPASCAGEALWECGNVGISKT